MNIRALINDYIREQIHPTGANVARVVFAQSRLIEFFKEREAPALKRVDIRAYIAWRREAGVADPTILREIGVLAAAFRHALREERIEKMPFIDTALLSRGDPRTRFLTEEEATRLLTETDEPIALLFFQIGFATGARVGAIAKLTWARVQFDSNTIDFKVPGARVTKKRVGKVRMADWLKPILLAAKTPDAKPEDYVLPKRHLGYYAKRALRKAGIDEKYVRCHFTRKTFASLAVQKGVPIAEVAGALHDTIQTTERNYAFLKPEHQTKAVNSFNPQGA